VENGKSLQLDEASGQWCDALAPWADGSGFGSPGEPNPSCTSCFRGGVLGPANSPKAGEVKITEIMANAPGAEDTDKDWFEVTNFTNTDLDLNNVEIWDDTDDDKAAHLIQSDNNDCVTIPATKTVVFARVADAAKNGVDPTRVLYVYKSAALNNSGYLALKLGTNVIDEVSYADAEDGKALQKDPASGTWCDAVKQYWTATDGTPAFGTPGEGNSPCGVVFCKENGQDRPVDPPDVGTLVISEIFANPDGDEGPREWLEIYVTPEAVGKDANGLEVVLGGNSKGKLAEGGDCLPLPAGYVVIAGSADVASNGGLTAVFAAMSLSLTNGGTDMMVRYSGKIIDAVTYGNVKEQVALQLDPAALDATSNDDPKQWCDATKTYNATGDKGTPGTENPSCGETFCTDSQGQAVPVTPPKPDALVITEIYANTPGQEDANKEWFEVFVPQNSAAAHLNGVGILSAAGQPPAFSFSSDQCIELKAGQIYVFCRDIDPGTNGGVTGCIKYSSVTLTNDNGFLGLGLPGVIYDAVYDYGKTKDGISKSLDPAKWNATDNDALSNWCDTPAGNTFGNGTTLGTPGLMNPACPQG
jgi:hypothetical protein